MRKPRDFQQTKARWLKKFTLQAMLAQHSGRAMRRCPGQKLAFVLEAIDIGLLSGTDAHILYASLKDEAWKLAEARLLDAAVEAGFRSLTRRISPNSPAH